MALLKPGSHINMSRVLRFQVNKLIRDKLPEIMRASGLHVFERTLEQNDFTVELKRKLLEEAAEAAGATSTDELLCELADVSEVIMALLDAHDLTIADLVAARVRKSHERGAFAKRIFNAAVEAEEGTPALNYYLARPRQYPRD